MRAQLPAQTALLPPLRSINMKSEYPISLAAADGPMTPVEEYPKGIRLTLPDVAELKSLPACGEITFRYVREDLHLRTVGEAPLLSASLCLCDIVKVKADEKTCDEKVEDVVDKLFEEAASTPEPENDE